MRGDTKMATAKKTHGERVTEETAEAANVVKGVDDAPKSRRDLKHDTPIRDEQAEINAEVEKLQKQQGSTASKEPGPKAS